MSANNTYRYIDVLGELLKKCNTLYHRSIRMTPTKANGKQNESTVWTVELHKPVVLTTIKVGHRVRMSKKETTIEDTQPTGPKGYRDCRHTIP